jgi:hypothetical protein
VRRAGKSTAPHGDNAKRAWEDVAVIDNPPAVGYVEASMKTTLTVTQAQAQFPALCRSGKTVAVTRHGEVAYFMVPRQRMADLLEQMEILSNPEAMKAINNAKAGKTKDYPLSVLDEDENNR